MPNILTESQKENILKRYANGEFNCAKIAREFGLTRQAISSLLRRRGIIPKSNVRFAHRKYSLNENYFDIIDTEEKAYFLGFLYADGYNNESRGEFKIALQAPDKEILEKFNDLLGSNRPLILQPKRLDKPNTQDQYVLYVSNTQLSKQLARLGCFQRKSLTLKFPTKNQVPHQLLRHFIRGYFDGDGSVYLSKIGNVGVVVISSHNFCKKLFNYIINLGYDCIIDKDKRTLKLRIVRIKGGNKERLRFMHWLYDNSQIFLSRKRKKLEEIESILKIY